MQAFLKREGNSCLVKPFSLEEFHSAVAKVLNAPTKTPEEAHSLRRLELTV